jgi:2-keto-myo-inositol isomerase
MAAAFSRRELFGHSALAASSVALAMGSVLNALAEPVTAAVADPTKCFRYCLNTSTLRGQKLPINEIVDIAAKAGYDALEPWLNELEAYQQAGGKLSDLRKQIADHGMTVESAIGFAPWLVDDDAARAKGLEQAKHDMDQVKQIGGIRIAAPPAGAYDVENVNLFVAAQRYRAMLDLGDTMEIVPEVEFWGGSKSLYKLAQSVFVAVESGHPKACLLPDVYHLFRGGSDFNGLKLLDGQAIHVLHINDYPGNIEREKQTDADRVYPGDGVAPLAAMYQNMVAAGFNGFLSLELFNRDYWQQDAFLVARTGLEKTKDTVAKAFA